MNSESTEERAERLDQKKAPIRGGQRWRIVLVLVVLAAAGATAADFLLHLPAKPVAYVIFQIHAQPYIDMKAIGDARQDFDYYRQVQTTLVKNRMVLNSAVS